MSPTIKQRWLDYFRACGYPDANGISTGMEGAVYSLVPGELVAKVWSRRGIDSLRRLEAFYERLASTNGRLPTPRILDIESDAIGQLLHRRVARFGDQLEPVVPHLDEVLEATLAFLRTRDDAEMSVIHGDLCPANVMVDDTLDPVAVLDFGFLSTVGDPAFDASIAGAIFNMYGPSARTIDEQFTSAMQESLGYGGEVLLAYRAIYSLLTSNVYAPNGDDGHFRWCVEMLGRDDVRDALNM